MALGNLTVRLGLDAADFVSGIDKAEAQAQKFAKRQEANSRAIDKQIIALRTQAQTVGFTSEQLKIYELRQKGASDAQLLATVNILKQNKAFAEAQQAIAKASASAKQAADKSFGIDKEVKALEDRAAVLGKTERQAKVFELAQKGATKAQQENADAALRQIENYARGQKIVEGFKRSMIAVGQAVAIASAAFVAGAVLFEKLVGGAANFQDLAEKTGASAETLASFKTAADVAGVSMDVVAGASVKLTKGLAGTDEETSGAANAIAQLGFNVKEFQKLDPGKQMEELARVFARFEDGAGKTAAAVALFGRTGAEQLPFLKELGGQTARQNILTAEQIKLADDYKDAQARLTSQITQYAQKLAIDVLPVVLDFKKALFETGKQILGIKDETSKLAGDNGIQTFAEQGARSLAVLLDATDLVFRGFQLVGTGIAGAAAQLTALRESGLEAAREVRRQQAADQKAIIDRPLFSSNLQAVQQQRRAEEAAMRAFDDGKTGNRWAGRQLDPNRFPGGGTGSASSKAAAEAKKRLDRQLSDLDNFIRAEDRILQARESALERHYQADQISINAYFEGRRAALELNTQATATAYDKQIAALEAFISKSKSATDKLEAQTKIGDVQQKQSEAQLKAFEAQARLDAEKKRAAQAYADQVDELRAKVLELSNTENAAAQAALIRFDIQNRALSQRATAEGDTGTLANIGVMRQREEAQTRINQLLQEAQLIEDRLSTTEARLHLERDLGLRGELASLGELGKARAASLPDLQKIADRYREIAAVSGDERLIAAAERFNQKIKELAATTDVLADKFRNVFQDSFADAFASFIDGTTSAKDAFKAFADDVLRQINRMVAQEIAGSLFSKGGGGNAGLLAGFVDFFADLFKAGGGPVAANQPYIVGEKGPEWFVPKTAGTIIPNGRQGGMSVHNTFVLPPGGVSRETQNQIALRAGQAIRQAQGRNA